MTQTENDSIESMKPCTATVRVAGSTKQFRTGTLGPSQSMKAQTIDTPTKLAQAISKLEEALQVKFPTHSILVLVNGVEASVLGGMDALIERGDEVVILPMFHGG